MEDAQNEPKWTLQKKKSKTQPIWVIPHMQTSFFPKQIIHFKNNLDGNSK